MMRRPIFQNEILSSINEDNEPRYELIHMGDGTVKLRLANEIATHGTPHSADNMNNMFDFENLESMKGNNKETSFSNDGNIIEEIKSVASGVVNAQRVTTFQNGEILVETTIFNDAGTDVIRATTHTTLFENDEIKEVIN